MTFLLLRQLNSADNSILTTIELSRRLSSVMAGDLSYKKTAPRSSRKSSASGLRCQSNSIKPSTSTTATHSTVRRLPNCKTTVRPTHTPEEWWSRRHDLLNAVVSLTNTRDDDSFSSRRYWLVGSSVRDDDASAQILVGIGAGSIISESEVAFAVVEIRCCVCRVGRTAASGDEGA